MSHKSKPSDQIYMAADPALIANERVNSCLKSNPPAVICMLGIKKAYDHVSWGFLMATID